MSILVQASSRHRNMPIPGEHRHDDVARSQCAFKFLDLESADIGRRVADHIFCLFDRSVPNGYVSPRRNQPSKSGAGRQAGSDPIDSCHILIPIQFGTCPRNVSNARFQTP